MKLRIQTIALLALLVAGCGGSGSSAPLANQPPTISAIPDQSTTANIPSAAIPFTVGDDRTQNLQVTANSDNEQVVQNSGLTLGGAGANRTLTVTPVVDTLGDAFITIVVTDAGGLSASASFLLTIDPQQLSLQQFTRSTFADDEDGEPVLVNAVAFDQDADGDDFADLIGL